MRKLATQLMPQPPARDQKPAERTGARRLHAGFRSALLECSGIGEHVCLADSLGRMLFKVHLAAVHDYDPQEASEFPKLLSIAASQFPGKRECADLFGVAHSTFYRWKLGEVIPHALMRAAVRERLLTRMTDGSVEEGDGPLLPIDRCGGLTIN